jgi:hypothetical protein
MSEVPLYAASGVQTKEKRILNRLMTSDRQLKLSREGSG